MKYLLDEIFYRWILKHWNIGANWSSLLPMNGRFLTLSFLVCLSFVVFFLPGFSSPMRSPFLCTPFSLYTFPLMKCINSMDLFCPLGFVCKRAILAHCSNTRFYFYINSIWYSHNVRYSKQIFLLCIMRILIIM